MAISQNFPEEGPTLNLNFAGSKVLDPRITFSRSSVGTYMDENGLIVTAAADEPRFDHRYVNGEIESLGLLVEEQRTNLILYNTKHDESYWVNHGDNSSETINTTETLSPDGTNNATKLFGNNGVTTRQSIRQGVTITSGTTYTFSVFLKQGQRRYASIWFDTTNISEGAYYGSTTIIDLQTGTLATGSQTNIVPYPNGWYRCYVTATPTATGNVNMQVSVGSPNNNVSGYIANGDGSSGIYIWGHQVEEGAFPTSYIPTTSSTVTRNHDRAYYENVDQTDWFSKTEGTVVFEHTDVPYDSSDDPHYPAVGFANTTNGSSNPSIQYFIMKHNGNGQYLVRPGGGDSANITPSGVVVSASKVGFVYKEDDYALVRNGSLVGTDTSGAVPAAYMLIFGMNSTGNTGNNWNAHLKNLQYYPTRLSNTVLQNLTK